jgi:hypothetical protein
LTGYKKCHTVRKSSQIIFGQKIAMNAALTLVSDQDAALVYLTEARKHHTQAAIANTWA